MLENISSIQTQEPTKENVSGKDAVISQQPQVAIVILNWNGKKYLEQFLPSVLNSSYINKRIIMADNASADESVLLLKKKYPEVEIILNK
ncbi:MAG TPA: glycosyltransferase, partial [Ferruginibacter sp.]|nr:glycosyltransferase [Ferruginibacter sp.]